MGKGEPGSNRLTNAVAGLRRLATSPAVGPSPSTRTGPAAALETNGGEAAADAGTTRPAAVLVAGTPIPSGFPLWMMWVAGLLWVVAAVAGTFGSSLGNLPREAYFSLDGQPVDTCFSINAAAYEGNPDVGTQWCTPDEVLGRKLPAEVDTFTGDIAWEQVDLEDYLMVFSRPDLWLSLGLGGIALIFLVGFSRATGTLRAGLAAAISVVFLGLLLFPDVFTGRIPSDMRGELVKAWQWVIAFYFSSEAAVQAWKISHPQSGGVGGDLAPTSSGTTTTE